MKEKTIKRAAVYMGAILGVSLIGVLGISYRMDIYAFYLFGKVRSGDSESRRQALSQLREFPEGRSAILSGLRHSDISVRAWCKRELDNWALGGEWISIVGSWNVESNCKDACQSPMERLAIILKESENKGVWKSSLR
jgi:hypothetical protein